MAEGRVLWAVIAPPNSSLQTLAPNVISQTRWQLPVLDSTGHECTAFWLCYTSGAECYLDDCDYTECAATRFRSGSLLSCTTHTHTHTHTHTQRVLMEAASKLRQTPQSSLSWARSPTHNNKSGQFSQIKQTSEETI